MAAGTEAAGRAREYTVADLDAIRRRAIETIESEIAAVEAERREAARNHLHWMAVVTGCEAKMVRCDALLARLQAIGAMLGVTPAGEARRGKGNGRGH